MSYVGIGTSDPNHPLEVEGQVFISNVEQGSATNLVPFEVHSDYTGITGDILEGARQFRLRVTPSATTTSNVNMDMGIEPTDGSYFYISNPVVNTALGSNTAFRIVQAGHVEIGSNLSVSGNVVASNIIGGSPLTLSSDSLVKVAGSGGLSVTGPVNVGGGGTITGVVSGTSATYSGQVQAATVLSTGNVNATGNVVATGYLTGASLSVSGAVQGSSASLGAIDGASLSVSGLVQGATVSSAGLVQGVTVSSTGTLTGSSLTVSGAGSIGNNLTVTGSITASGNIIAYSDRRLKSDIHRIENALDKLTSIGGYTYMMNGVTNTGLIAQEVLEILPEAVSGSEDTQYALAYGNLMGIVVEAIKELKQDVEKIKNKINI